MRKIKRLPLSPDALDRLHELTEEVRAAEDPVQAAKELWKNRTNNTSFAEIREVLGQMASGLQRCMYCEDSQGTDIEHFHPKNRYPERAFTWANYLLACSHCNSNAKRDRFPLDSDQQPLLLDPSRKEDDPLAHLALSPSSGKLQAKTPKGEASIDVFGLDRADLEKGRRNRWYSLTEAVIPRYAQAKREGDQALLAKLGDSIRQEPFSSVLCRLIEVAASPGGAEVLSAELRAAVAECPELAEWAA